MLQRGECDEAVGALTFAMWSTVLQFRIYVLVGPTLTHVVR